MNKTKCPDCNVEVTTNNITKHKNSKSCLRNQNKTEIKPKIKVDRSGKNNPMYGKPGANQFTTGRQTEHSSETKEKIRLNNIGHKHTAEFKQARSFYAKKNNLGGVRQSNHIHYKDKILGSTYELMLVEDLERNNIKWDTCKKFNYTSPDGKARTYTPDIYLPDYDIYLDPKNDFLINSINPRLGFKDSDKIKWACEQNEITVFILNKNQLTWESILTEMEKV